MARKKNRLLTDALREIKKTMSRFLSLFLLSALAVAFLAGLRTTAPDMERTADGYYDRLALMDLHILSTLGLTEADISTLAAQPGIATTEGAYTVDSLVHLEENDLILKLLSLSPSGMNAPELLSGRLPENDRECLVEPKLLASAGLGLGDSISFDTGDGDFADALKYSTYTVVGTTHSPLYISVERGSSSLGAGTVFAFALLPRGAFDMDYTDGYLRVHGAADLRCYDDVYKDRMDDLIDTLKPLGDQRAGLRHDQVVGEANVKLDDAQQEFDDAEAEANQKLTDAKKELDDARKKLDDGRAEWLDGKLTLIRETADAKRKIAAAEKELPDAKIDLDQGEIDYLDGLKTLEDGKVEFADGLKKWQGGKIEYDDGYEELLDGEAAYAESYDKLMDGQTEYNDGRAEYHDGMIALQNGAGQLAAAEKALKSARAQIDAGSSALADGQRQYEKGKEQFDQLSGGVEQLYGGILAFTSINFDIGATLATRDQLLDPGHAWSLTDGILAALVLSMGQEQLTAMLPALVEGGMLTQEQADAFITQLDEAIDAATKRDDPLPVSVFIHTIAGMVSNAEAQLTAAKAQLDSGSAALSSGYAQYSKGNREYKENKAKLDDSVKELQDAAVKLDDAEKELNDGWAELADGRKEIDDGWADLADAKKELDDGQITLDENAVKIADGEREAADARVKLDDGWREYHDGVAELADAKIKLPAETAKAQKKLADAEIELADGEKEYADGLIEYADGKKEADEKLSDARQKLNDARRKISEIETCKWYVLGRNTNIGYVSYQQDAERMGNLASVFPLIFFLVAALVCLTTMTRMVEEQRVQIGGMKALGYSKGAIALKYVGYGFLASFFGGVAGLALGCFLIPWVIFNAWKILYTVGELTIPFYLDISAMAVGAAVFCVTGTALAASFATLTAVPAELMRPRAPKPGKRVLLERVKPLWNHMAFTWKVTMRNLFRYKKRFLMTVVGIGGCTALIVSGFGLRNSIFDILDKQFDEISTYSTQISLADDVTADELTEIDRVLSKTENVEQWMPCYDSSLSVESATRSMDAYLFAVEDTQTFQSFISLRHRLDDIPVVLPREGVVLTEKLANMLSVTVGDQITLDGDKRVQATVVDITENYVFHYVYLSADYYAQLFGEAPATNVILAQYGDDSKPAADEVSSALIGLSGVTSVSLIRESRDTFTKSIQSVDYGVIVIIVSAAALAFVVLYNLTNINITERMRELATLKVLGFYDGELAAYVYRENVFLTIFGVGLGLVMGKFLHQWLVLTVEIDMVMFGRTARPSSYLAAAGLTVLFSLLVNLAARRKLKKIDMVESLKTVE